MAEMIGHWQMVLERLHSNILDEQTLQRFLSALTSATTGFERGFNASVDQQKVWGIGSA